MLGVHPDLLGREDIEHVLGLEPVLVELLELIVVDVLDLAHLQDPG